MRINFKFLVLGFCFLTVAACSPVTAKRGNMLETYQIEEVKAGQHTRTDVLNILGSPTTVSTFNPRIWYYIGQETEKRGILDEAVVDEKVVAVAFGDDGLVEEIRELDNKRADIPVDRTKTPTHGNDLSFTQQLLGNIGRFNAPSSTK